VLGLIHDIAEALDNGGTLEEALAPALERMATYLRLERGTLTLFRRDQGEVLVEMAYGLSPEQVEKGKYRVGEGITGRVAASGKPVLVPRVVDEPEFLNRTDSREALEDLAFLCVPVLRQGRVVGTLAADRRTADGAVLEEHLHVLETISFMIAETAAIHLLVQETEGEDAARLRDDNARLRAELAEMGRSASMVGNTPPMRRLYGMIARVAPTNTTVLILGESGVGKERVADAVHANSRRAKGPMVKFNCGALPESMVESELFGHTKGAFTGAVADRKGRFEMADGGTVFLDEVGELSLSIQVKLLRVLQEREVEPLGSGRPIKVDVRIVAATNRDLAAMVKDGRFREDLYYRLAVFPIQVPALRNRKSDIPALVDHFVEQFSREHEKKAVRISTPAIDMLVQHHWPGNVRELSNVIERAVLLCEDGVIRGYHLPPTLQTPVSGETALAGGMQTALDSLEREYILEALKAAKGNVAAAARHLGVTERKLGLRIRKHRLTGKVFRNAA
jgi:Nif-specific regulatory protein